MQGYVILSDGETFDSTSGSAIALPTCSDAELPSDVREALEETGGIRELTEAIKAGEVEGAVVPVDTLLRSFDRVRFALRRILRAFDGDAIGSDINRAVALSRDAVEEAYKIVPASDE